MAFIWGGLDRSLDKVLVFKVGLYAQDSGWREVKGGGEEL